jgi:hypothetical protein
MVPPVRRFAVTAPTPTPQLAVRVRLVAAPAAPPRLDPDTVQARLRSLRGDQTYTLNAEERDGISACTTHEQQMILATLDRLDQVKAGTLTSAQYMISVLRDAARIAGNNTEEFTTLVGLVFCEQRTHWFERGRVWLGAGFRAEGWAIESTFRKIESHHGVDGGYNASIVDSEDIGSTVTHHFGEFLRVGEHTSRFIGMAAGWYIDSKTTNPGDVRSAYFAVMVGNALSSGDISIADAISLTEWAYTTNTAPWGPGTYLEKRDYHIEDWLRLFRGHLLER